MKRQARPDRPSEFEAPQLTEPIWQIVEQCWVQQPKDRPIAKVVCEKLSALLKSKRREHLGSSMESTTASLPPYSSVSPIESTTSSHSSTKPPPVPNKSLSIDTSPRHLEWIAPITPVVEHSLASGSSGTFLPRPSGFQGSHGSVFSHTISSQRSNMVVLSDYER